MRREKMLRNTQKSDWNTVSYEQMQLFAINLANFWNLGCLICSAPTVDLDLENA